MPIIVTLLFGLYISIRSLANIIPRWIIVTSHEHVTIVTNNPRATNPLGAPPHDLSVVAAHLALHAGIGGVGVVLFLVGPRVDGVAGRPARAAAPKYVLAERELALLERVLERAIRLPLRRPPPRVPLQLKAPRERQLKLPRARQVVREQELYRLAYAPPAQGL